MQIFQNDAVLLERYQKKQSFQTLPMDTIENATVVDSVSFYGVKCTKVRSSLCCLRLRVVRIPMQQHQIPIMRTKCRMLYTTLLTTYQVKSAMGFFLLHLVVCVETQRRRQVLRRKLNQSPTVLPWRSVRTPRKSNLAIKNGATRKSEYILFSSQIFHLSALL